MRALRCRCCCSLGGVYCLYCLAGALTRPRDWLLLRREGMLRMGGSRDGDMIRNLQRGRRWRSSIVLLLLLRCRRLAGGGAADPAH